MEEGKMLQTAEEQRGVKGLEKSSEERLRELGCSAWRRGG